MLPTDLVFTPPTLFPISIIDQVGQSCRDYWLYHVQVLPCLMDVDLTNPPRFGMQVIPAP